MAEIDGLGSSEPFANTNEIEIINSLDKKVEKVRADASKQLRDLNELTGQLLFVSGLTFIVLENKEFPGNEISEEFRKKLANNFLNTDKVWNKDYEISLDSQGSEKKIEAIATQLLSILETTLQYSNALLYLYPHITIKNVALMDKFAKQVDETDKVIDSLRGLTEIFVAQMMNVSVEEWQKVAIVFEKNQRFYSTSFVELASRHVTSRAA